MTARLLAIALALVALATHPIAFDVVPLKRACFLAVASALLLLKPMQAALVRSIDGAARTWVWMAGAFACSAAAVIATRGLSTAATVVTLRALLELLLFALVVVLAREVAWERAGTLLAGVVAVGALVGGIAVAQVLGFDLVYGASSPRVPVATFGNTNAFAAFAAPCLAVAAARAGRPRAFLAMAATLVLAAALVLARGRGGWIAGAAGLAVALLLIARRGGKWKRVAVLAVAGVGLGFAVNARAAKESELGAKPLGLGLERSSNVVRLDVARATLELFEKRPLLGSGPGQFRAEFPRVRLEREARTPTREGAASEVDHPHVELLRLLAEGGAITAILALLAVLGTAFVAIRSDRATRNDADGTVRAALAAGGVAWLAASLTWSTLYDPASALLGALLLGALLAGDSEMSFARPRERPLALLFTLAVVAASIALATPTLLAERADWLAARDGTLDRADLLELERAAARDRFNLSRQYSIGHQFLEAARVDAAERDLQLARAHGCFERALALSPTHVPSLADLAEVESLRGDEKGARAALVQVHELEPWRGGLDAALREQAKAMRAAGHVRPAAQVLDELAARAPEDAELQRELALALKDLDDDAGYARAYRQSQIAFALVALTEGRSEDARQNLAVARRFAPNPANPANAANATLDVSILEDLLEACVDLQRNRVDEARARLERLGVEGVRKTVRAASPTAERFLRLLAAQPSLRSEAERLGLVDLLK